MKNAGIYVKSQTAVDAVALRDSIWAAILETEGSDEMIDLAVALEAVHDVLGYLLKWACSSDVPAGDVSVAGGVPGKEGSAFKIDPPEKWISEPGAALHRWRKHNQMTLSDVSKLVDISISHLSAIEHGKIMPSLKTLQTILDAIAKSKNDQIMLN